TEEGFDYRVWTSTEAGTATGRDAGPTTEQPAGTPVLLNNRHGGRSCCALLRLSWRGEAMQWDRIAYAILCVLAPVGWGLVVFWLSNEVEEMVRRQGRGKGQNEAEATLPPTAYNI